MRCFGAEAIPRSCYERAYTVRKFQDETNVGPLAITPLSTSTAHRLSSRYLATKNLLPSHRVLRSYLGSLLPLT